jgi:hypothetical protein
MYLTEYRRVAHGLHREMSLIGVEGRSWRFSSHILLCHNRSIAVSLFIFAQQRDTRRDKVSIREGALNDELLLVIEPAGPRPGTQKLTANRQWQAIRQNTRRCYPP